MKNMCQSPHVTIEERAKHGKPMLLIQDQIKGDKELNYDPSRGTVKAPLLLWGAYLWGDGMTPRKSDGLVWKREDLGGDGTHPSNSGRQKVAELLLKFCKTDPNVKT